MTDIEDEVPPLEDMSETIKQLSISKHDGEKNKQYSQYLEATSNEHAVKNNNILKMLDKEEESPLKNLKSSNTTLKHSDNENFCGFKKGFLSGKSKPNTAPKSKPTLDKEQQFDVTHNKGAAKDANVIPEVQDAMKKQIPLLQSNDWVTEDLLAKIMKHPKLSKQFMDPRFSQAISKFQSNPKEVMEMCATNDELREFIREFCAIMGDHFTGLADQQEKKDSPTTIQPSKTKKAPNNPSAKKSSNNKNNNTKSEEDTIKMQQILSDPEVSKILQSSKVQQLFTWLRSDPEKAQRMLQRADGEFRYHIQKLIDVGLLQMAR